MKPILLQARVNDEVMARELCLKCTERERGGSKVLQSTPYTKTQFGQAQFNDENNYYQNREKRIMKLLLTTGIIGIYAATDQTPQQVLD